MSNNCWLQLLECQDLMLYFLIYDSKKRYLCFLLLFGQKSKVSLWQRVMTIFRTVNYLLIK